LPCKFFKQELNSMKIHQVKFPKELRLRLTFSEVMNHDKVSPRQESTGDKRE